MFERYCGRIKYHISLSVEFGYAPPLDYHFIASLIGISERKVGRCTPICGGSQGMSELEGNVHDAFSLAPSPLGLDVDDVIC